jgi:hypothetical protein
MDAARLPLGRLGAFVRGHRADDSITRAPARLTRTDLIIIDDIGLLPDLDAYQTIV